jgi:hypothetical protein
MSRRKSITGSHETTGLASLTKISLEGNVFVAWATEEYPTSQKPATFNIAVEWFRLLLRIQ